MPRKVIEGPEVPRSHLPFSPAVEAGPYVFVSGQASVDVTGKIISDTFEGEMRRSLENVRKVLAAAGLGFEHVVRVTSYLGSQEDLAEYNRIYREYFSEPYPARSTLMGCLGTLLKFEVDVVAYREG